MDKIIKITEITTINDWVETVTNFEVSVSVDGKSEYLSLSSCEECPEDATFDRELSGVFNVTSMLELVYEYAKKGYELKLEKLEEK